MQEQQDADIIHRVLQGDVRAYAVLVNRYRHLVYTVAYRLTGSKEDSEEVAQDVFVKAYRSLASFDGRGKFSTWLYAITRNAAISKTRSPARLMPVTGKDLTALAGDADNVSEHQTLNEKKKVLGSAISRLASDDALIITLFYLHEQTIEDISRIMDINGSNAKVRLFRARKKLKEILNKSFGSDLQEYRSEKKNG